MLRKQGLSVDHVLECSIGMIVARGCPQFRHRLIFSLINKGHRFRVWRMQVSS
jgi:hypothetical protein